MRTNGLLQIAPVDAKCYVCGKAGMLVVLDTDTDGYVCQECIPHVQVAAANLTAPGTGMTYPDGAIKEAHPL